MGAAQAAHAGRTHALEGWPGGRGVPCHSSSPEADKATRAAEDRREARCWRYFRCSCSHQQRELQESTRASTRHVVDRLLVHSRPAHLSRVPARMERGPGLASDDSWRRDEKGAAHLLHGHRRSPLHWLKALDERLKLGRKRTDDCSRRRHQALEGLVCYQCHARYECLVHRYSSRRSVSMILSASPS